MGAVMGSKNLKAVIIKGTGEIPVADMDALKKMGKEGFQDILKTTQLQALEGSGHHGDRRVVSGCLDSPHP